MESAYFKNWITGWHWGVRIALFFIMVSGLVQLGLFVLTQSYMVAYLGAQPEDIQFGVMSTYAGIITVLPLQFRFFKYFQTRSYLLASMMMAIVLNIACLYCQDINLFLIIRFAQGIITANVIVFGLLLVFTRLPSERAKTVAPAVFYGTLLSNAVLIGLLAGVVVESADWKVTYYYLVLFQLLLLVIILLMLKEKSVTRHYPLYQVDWAGVVIFACAALSLAYTTIYGSKYYWFADVRIRRGAIATVIGVVLFLYRQYMLKRPVIHLSIFKSRNFVAAVCLLAIYYGCKDSINLVYNYAGGVLKWSALQVMTLALWNIVGMVGVLVVVIRLMLVKKVTIKGLLIAGFALLGAFNCWMSFLLTPDLAFTDLLLPVFLQGVASGFLFVPIMIYVLSSTPAYAGMSGMLVAACTRFTATANSFAGFYNLQLYFNQYFKEGFLGYLTTDNQNMATRLTNYRELYASKGFTVEQASVLANAAVWQNLTQQSQLLTNRALFIGFAILSLVVALLMLVIPAIGKIWLHLNKQRMAMVLGDRILNMAGMIKTLTISEKR
ncbi:MFS transporter [Mucilaginibacter sabulilitoris]|uniref:MFS transporter n=1 Tax=Mucilaginibacter sabulilitoris TaxID=1173583 RepID=A0ABZ0TF21_9SPHI|nr:MFS transporter [Mucilaginibacter sabulilitoris]WPU91572.1 MFS transporter [Mucilaginibacter sabulilitoris]